MPTNEQHGWDREFLTRLVNLIDPTQRFGHEAFNPVFVHPLDDADYQVVFSTLFWEGRVVGWQSAQFSGGDALLHAFEFAHGLPGPKSVFNLGIARDPAADRRS